jgi:hypothetical protein
MQMSAVDSGMVRMQSQFRALTGLFYAKWIFFWVSLSS